MDSVPTPFCIGSSESSGNLSDNSCYSENFTGEPAEYDPQLTPERVRLNGYDSSETFSDMLEDVAVNYRTHHSTQPRPVSPMIHVTRRSSTASQSDSDKYGTLDDTDMSVNSLTSVNSISSLLREKLLMNIQKMSKNKEVQADYKLRAFIIFLFIVIVCVLKLAHVYYDRHVLQKAYFKYTRFNKDDRFLRLFGVDGHEIAFGYLGVDLAEREKAFDCLAEHRTPPNAQCFEWMQKARLYLSHEERPEGLNCYTVEWFSLTDKYNPIDCYEDGEQYGHWLVE